MQSPNSNEGEEYLTYHEFAFCLMVEELARLMPGRWFPLLNFRVGSPSLSKKPKRLSRTAAASSVPQASKASCQGCHQAPHFLPIACCGGTEKRSSILLSIAYGGGTEKHSSLMWREPSTCDQNLDIKMYRYEASSIACGCDVRRSISEGCPGLNIGYLAEAS